MKFFYTLIVALLATFSMNAATMPNDVVDKESGEQNNSGVTMLKSTLYGKLKANNAIAPTFTSGDAPTVITEQPEGELHYFSRTYGDDNIKGWKIEEGKTEPDCIYQLGEVKVVYGANNKIYMQNPVCFYETYTWIEGTISADGKTASFPVGQYLSYDASAQDGAQLFAGTYSIDFDTDPISITYEKDTTTPIKFKIDKDKGTLELESLTNVNKNLSLFSSKTGKWIGYGDYGTILKQLPALDVVVPPLDLEVADWRITYFDEDSETKSHLVKVGCTDGGVYYVKGICPKMPEAWIKGSLSEGRVLFSSNQYLGSYNDDGTALDLFFGGYKYNDKTKTNEIVAEVKFWFDEDNQIIEEPNHSILINPNRYKVAALCYLSNVALSKGTGPKPDPQLVEVPSTAIKEEYEFTAKDVTRSTTTDIKRDVVVAFDGNNVYIQGLFKNNFAKSSWIKGTINTDGTVVFKGRQYLGTSNNNNYYAFGDVSALSDLHMIFNKQTQEFTPPSNNNFITMNEGKYEYKPALKMSTFKLTSKNPTGINDVNSENNASLKAVKVIENGMIFIERGGKRYNLQGVEVSVAE